MSEYIFTVNPGATTTKCALYTLKENDVEEYVIETIEHPDKIINKFEDISSQVDYREDLVMDFIKKHIGNEKIIACAGRGGMLPPVPSGAILINKELVNFSLKTPVYQHASNLGAPLAYRVAQRYNVQAFIVDPVGVDEFSDIAKISGSPSFPRFSFVHALNIRATIRKFGLLINKDFNEIKCVIAHLGAGFSIAAFDRGKIVDNDNRMESAAFTPERAGGVPPIPLVNACFSGKYTKKEIMRKLYGEGGLYAYLKTKDLRVVLKRIEEKNKKAELIYNAMIYQIAKQIAAMSSVLCFDLDGVLITGGIAFSDKVVQDIKKRIENVLKVYVFPGSNENESLAQAIFRILKKQEKYMYWPDAIKKA